ncbi:MAG: ATP-binding cassette domain-containing protein [Clostridia bacterium]|nr:ATP-binding cassette domain-containing protein [Clostridia bacterium]MDD4571271.1 ATP-binding cassette domain-containing protein [Clostridia bacterium]
MLNINIKRKLSFFDLEANLNVDKEIIVLWGPSGAGKTSLLLSVAGLLKPDYGEIILNDKLLYSSEKKVMVKPQKRNIGFVFQNHALFPHMTVAHNVAYSNPKARDEVNTWLNAFGVGHLAKRYPRQLSGGESQRVAVARALVAKPEVLLLDEPFSSLDRETKLKLRQELKDLNKKWQIPFIVVTHDRDDADFLGNRIIPVLQGKLAN